MLLFFIERIPKKTNYIRQQRKKGSDHLFLLGNLLFSGIEEKGEEMRGGGALAV